MDQRACLGSSKPGRLNRTHGLRGPQFEPPLRARPRWADRSIQPRACVCRPPIILLSMLLSAAKSSFAGPPVLAGLVHPGTAAELACKAPRGFGSYPIL